LGRHQPKHEPFLFLADTHRPPVAANIAPWQSVTQPAAGTADDADMLRSQAELFLQLPKQGVLGLFAALNSALRELPRLLADTLCPEHLSVYIAQNNANVGPEPLRIDHWRALCV